MHALVPQVQSRLKNSLVDRKLEEEYFQGTSWTQHLRASLPSSPFYQCEQLHGVAPLVQEAGYAVALEVYGRLLNLECDEQVAAAVFDSWRSIQALRSGPPFIFSACLTDLA